MFHASADAMALLEDPTVYLALAVYLTALGAVVGSFLNVCIHRIPEGISLVHPRSHCPRCGHTIFWFDNVPILSFLLLRAKCRYCEMPIRWRYPAVEALTAFCFWFSLRQFGWTPNLAVALLFSSALIVMAFIDLDLQIIPDCISKSGILVGLAISALWPGLHVAQDAWHGFLAGCTGAVVGAAVLWIVDLPAQALYGHKKMGGGDFKLFAMMGTFLGWRGDLMALLLGSLGCTLMGFALLALKRKGRWDPIPFGPFLAAGGWAVFTHAEFFHKAWQRVLAGVLM